MTCLDHVTGLGTLLDLGRERLCMLTMVEPTGHQRVGPASGTTQSPGEPLHPWCLHPLLSLRGSYSLSVTPEVPAFSFLLCFPQTYLVALPSLPHHCLFPLLLCLQLLCPLQICFAPNQKLHHLCSLHKTPSLSCSRAFHLLP